MSRIKELASMARICVPREEGPLYVRHADNMPYAKAREYLGEHLISEGDIDKLVTLEGKLVLPDETPNVYGLFPHNLDNFLAKRFRPVYDLADDSLNGMAESGYNSHGPAHIDAVTSHTNILLLMAAYGDAVRFRGIAAARGHDLGNTFGRKFHSLISPVIFKKLVPTVTEDLQQWRIIRRAIQLHDITIASELIKSWGARNSEELIRRLREDFGPEALAVIIADKIDMGRSRLTTKDVTRDAVNNDPHLVINLLGETERLTSSPDKKTLTWNIKFTPDEDINHPQFNRSRSRHNGIRVIAPDMMHSRHRDKDLPIPHFDTWKQLFWNLYFSRAKMVVLASFALFPQLNEVSIAMRDLVNQSSSRRRNSGETTEFVFSREYLEEDFDNIITKYHPKGERKSLLSFE